MCQLSSREQETLLALARKSIELVLAGGPPEIREPSGSLAQARGAFVTLHCRGHLRGCIGRVMDLGSLASVVAECAAIAATADPRFSRLTPEDLAELEIEISVLSTLRRATADEIEPGVHGLFVSLGAKRGILLPQVAEKHKWSREYFLQQTCYKAGLDADAWKNPQTRIEVFSAQVFSEAEFPSLTGARADHIGI